MQASLFSDNVPIVKSTEAYAKEAESAPRCSRRQRAALASTEGHGSICRTHQSYQHKVYKLLVLYGFRCPNNFQAGTGQRKWNKTTFDSVKSEVTKRNLLVLQPNLLVIWLSRTGGRCLLPSGGDKKITLETSACRSRPEKPSCKCLLQQNSRYCWACSQEASENKSAAV